MKLLKRMMLILMICLLAAAVGTAEEDGPSPDEIPQPELLQDGDWIYFHEKEWGTAALVQYLGEAAPVIAVPEYVGGLPVRHIPLDIFPPETECIYVPYNSFPNGHEMNLQAGETRIFYVIRYLNYEQAAESYSFLYKKDPEFTEGTYAACNLRRYVITEKGQEEELDPLYPAEKVLTEIGGVRLSAGNITHCLTYTEGEFTFLRTGDANDLVLANAIRPADRENALFVPSFMNGEEVRGLHMEEIPEGISELLMPYGSSLLFPPENCRVYCYTDDELAKKHEMNSGCDLLPGELLLVEAWNYENGNKTELKQDYSVYPAEIDGKKVRKELSGEKNVLTYTSGEYTYYRISETEIGICGFSGKIPKKLTVPETIDGMTVVAIDSLMSDKWVFEVPGSSRIVLPSTLVSLGWNALYSRGGNIDLPEGLKEIGTYGLWFLGMKELKLPSTVEWLGRNAFQQIDLRKVTLPEGVRKVPDSCFWRCENLQSVTLPAGVAEIGRNAFRECKKLTSVTFTGDTPPEILGAAFLECSKKLTFTAPAEWEELKEYAEIHGIAFKAAP